MIPIEIEFLISVLDDVLDSVEELSEPLSGDIGIALSLLLDEQKRLVEED